jgi:uncharacterized protein (DUF1778 family)
MGTFFVRTRRCGRCAGQKQEGHAVSGQTGDQAGNEAEPNGKLRRLKRQPGGRTKVVWVRLSDREATVIKARAERAGVSVPRFLVESAVTGEQTVSERHALYRTLLATRRTVAGLANNVNQLARVANATGRVPGELGEMARALTGAAAALEESLGDLRSTSEVA